MSVPGKHFRASLCASRRISRTPAGMSYSPTRDILGKYTHSSHLRSPVSLAGDGVLIPDLVSLTPEARQVLAACRSTGGRPLIVGGSVRDGLYSKLHSVQVDFKDIDIEVHGAMPEDVLDAIPGKKGVYGAEFGVINTRLGGQDFDISPPRRDNKIGVGYRGFEVELDPDMGFDEAFARRDVTVNAMGWDPETGELIDPFGGRADLEAGVLRHTSAAFTEDPTRVLRLAQFAGRFGMTIHPETAELAGSISDRFSAIASDKVWKEMRKLAGKSVQPSLGLQALADTGWIEHFPALSNAEQAGDGTWEKMASAADRAAFSPENIRSTAVLAAMFQGNPAAKSFMSGCGAPNEDRDLVTALASVPLPGTEAPTRYQVKTLLRALPARAGVPAIREWGAMVAACTADERANLWTNVAEEILAARELPPLVTGQHLIAGGMKPGKEFKAILQDCLDAQDRGEFNDEATGLKWMEGRTAR